MKNKNLIKFLEEKYPEVLQKYENEQLSETNQTNKDDEVKKEESDTKKQPEESIEGIKKAFDLLQKDHTKISNERDTLREKIMVIAQEFNNQKTLFEKSLEQEHERVNTLTVQKIADKLIGILDTLKLAESSAQKDKNILMGIQMISKQFVGVLKQMGIAEKIVKEGDEFDKDYFEAVETAEGGESNTIKQIISFPFVLNENILVKAGRAVVFK